MYISICKGLRGRNIGKKLLTEEGVLIQSDGNVLELERSDGWAPKSLQMVIEAMKLKDTYSLEGKL